MMKSCIARAKDGLIDYHGFCLCQPFYIVGCTGALSRLFSITVAVVVGVPLLRVAEEAGMSLACRPEVAPDPASPMPRMVS